MYTIELRFLFKNYFLLVYLGEFIVGLEMIRIMDVHTAKSFTWGFFGGFILFLIVWIAFTRFFGLEIGIVCGILAWIVSGWYIYKRKHSELP